MAAFLRRLARPNLLRKARSLAIMTIPVAYCTTKDKKDKKVDMSHEALIRQACILSVNSSSQLLTHMLIAISEVGEAYRKSMSELIQILDDSTLILTNGNSAQQEEISELILIARTAVDANRKAMRELSSLMDYVEKLATSTAETAFLAGAENGSTIICERLNSALKKVPVSILNDKERLPVRAHVNSKTDVQHKIKEELELNKRAEDELLISQQLYIAQITESKKPAGEAKPDRDEHDKKPESEGT